MNGYHKQFKQQERYFLRQYFLQGMELIAHAYNDSDNTNTHALRLVDYFSRLALSSNDGELFLILNTALHGALRKKLEKPDNATTEIYYYSVQGVQEIGRILRENALKRKGIVPAAKPPIVEAKPGSAGRPDA